MLSSVKKHVTFLEATLAFLRQQLESSPSSHHLRHNTTDHNIGTLIATAEEANQAINRLSDSTKYLSAHLHKVNLIELGELDWTLHKVNLTRTHKITEILNLPSLR